MEEKENQNWKEISKDSADVTKKVKDSPDDENIVDDLKESLVDSIQNTSKLLTTIIEKVDSTIKDEEIRKETKEVINKINNEIQDTIKDSRRLLKDYVTERAEAGLATQGHITLWAPQKDLDSRRQDIRLYEWLIIPVEGYE